MLNNIYLEYNSHFGAYDRQNLTYQQTICWCLKKFYDIQIDSDSFFEFIISLSMNLLQRNKFIAAHFSHFKHFNRRQNIRTSLLEENELRNDSYGVQIGHDDHPTDHIDHHVN